MTSRLHGASTSSHGAMVHVARKRVATLSVKIMWGCS